MRGGAAILRCLTFILRGWRIAMSVSRGVARSIPALYQGNKRRPTVCAFSLATAYGAEEPRHFSRMPLRFLSTTSNRRHGRLAGVWRVIGQLNSNRGASLNWTKRFSRCLRWPLLSGPVSALA